jgi:hypothetical protein
VRHYALCILVLLLITTSARAEPLQIIKTVPEGATIEYRVRGEIVQSQSLPAGTYRITVEEIRAAQNFRRRHEH